MLEGLVGHGHMTPPDKQCLEDFVFIISPRQSHLIMYAHILLLALQEARSATSTPAYLRRVVEYARLHVSPQGWGKTKKLLEIIPSEHQVMVFRYGLVFLSCCWPFLKTSFSEFCLFMQELQFLIWSSG